MTLSSKYLWASCLIATLFTMLFVIYTSTQSMGVQLRLKISTPSSSSSSSKAMAATTDIEQTMKQEKFITFSPHSGLHNQRIAIINALLLAKALDRTLILPDINIGNAIYWKDTPKSEFRLAECAHIKQSSNSLCKDFKKYVPAATEAIFDLSSAHAQGIRTLQRSTMSLNYFETVWNSGEDDIYRLDDYTRSSYRLYDSADNDEDILQFAYRVDLPDLKQRPEKFIVFGSLHYTRRIAFQEPKMMWLLKYLHQEISLVNPIVTHQALTILPLLGGPGKFVGVHLRQGDGVFKHIMEETIHELRDTLQRTSFEGEQNQQHFNTDNQQELALKEAEKSNSESLTDHPVSDQDGYKLAVLDALKKDVPDLLNQCVKFYDQSSHPRLRLVFMATDTHQPRVTLSKLFEEFPCIFTLSDFPDVITSTLSMGPMLTGDASIDEEMARLGTSTNGLLLPMIDAEIASHGSHFIGTKKSTFSAYINNRYKRFQMIYNSSSSL